MARVPGGFGVRRPDRSVGLSDVRARERIQPGSFTQDPGMRAQAGQFTDVTSRDYARQAAAQAKRGGALEFGTSVGAERDAGRDALVMEIVGMVLATMAGGGSGYRNPGTSGPIPGYNRLNPPYPPSPHLTPLTRRPHTVPSPFFGAKDTFPYVKRLYMGGMRPTIPTTGERLYGGVLGGVSGGAAAALALPTPRGMIYDWESIPNKEDFIGGSAGG